MTDNTATVRVAILDENTRLLPDKFVPAIVTSELAELRALVTSLQTRVEQLEASTP